MTQHMLFETNGWYSQYPPGHSALLSLGVLVGLPWVIPILLTTASMLLIYLAAKKMYGSFTAQVALILSIFCPFMIFMGSSFMNHVSSLFFTSLILFLFCLWEEKPRAGLMALLGCGVGGLLLCRPLEGAALGLVFGLFALPRVLKDSLYSHVLAGALAVFVFIGLFFSYNFLTTGDFLLPGYFKLWGANHGLGFHESPWGESHTPISGLRNELYDLSLLNEFLFDWPIPALLPIGLFLLLSRKIGIWDMRITLAFFFIPFTYFFYWHRDAFLGPRFLYSGTAFLIPLLSHALVSGIASLDTRSIKIPNLFRSVKTIPSFFHQCPSLFPLWKSYGHSPTLLSDQQ